MNRYYISGCYELDDMVNSSKEKLYLGGDFYSAPAVFVKENTSNWNIYYICRDYLGSITHITNSSGSVIQELSYDAWGRLRNPSNQTAYTPDNEPALFLGRGYTGHEHLTRFGLINMNARLYDPALGRFLSPDPFVQAPGFSQSYNRYSYALNNPMRYTDPSGEFLGSFIPGFFKGLFTGGAPFKEGWKTVRNEWNILRGLFTTNSNESGFFRKSWEIVSRFTWQGPQSMLGFTTMYVSNVLTLVDDVDHYGGATIAKYYGGNWGAFTLGSFVMGDENIAADPNNSLFQHEYGHYLQSQSWGPAYITRAGYPSLFDTFGREGDHIFHPVEQDANARAFKYFNEKVSGFYQTEVDWEDYPNRQTGWDFRNNPLNVNNDGARGYVDYNDPVQMALVNALKVTPSVFDYLLPQDLTYGFRNHVHYNAFKFRIKY